MTTNLHRTSSAHKSNATKQFEWLGGLPPTPICPRQPPA